MRLVSFVLFGSLALGASSGPAADATDGDASGRVVRISVELVQLDAVVTDKKGRAVRDLGPSDFEVRVDGKPRAIVQTSYVRFGAPPSAPATATPAAPAEAETAEAAPAAAAASTPPRTIVFVVDDLGLSTRSVDATRRGLREAISRLDPADRVAVVTTAKGPLSPTPTTDHAQALAAVEALRFRPWSRDPLTALGSSQSTFIYLQQGVDRYAGGSFDDRNLRLVMDSLGVLKHAIASLRDVPGRKALLLVSEGFADLSSLNSSHVHDIYWPLDRLYGDADDVRGALRRLGDLAARASVVVHAIDPRGLDTTGWNAVDNSPMDPRSGAWGDQLRARSVALQYSESTLQYLPDETGGLAILDQNDPAAAVGTILDDLEGYYLIGFEPDESTFSKKPRFHEVDVKVKRPGLRVRTRNGFYGVTDDQVAAVAP